MKILLVSATVFEVPPFLKKFKKSSVKKNLSRYTVGKHSVDVLVTGIGMTATAYHLGKALDQPYDIAINAGVAGSFKKNIPLGTVVNVVSDCFADLGTEDGEKFLTLEEIRLGESRIKNQESRNKAIRKALMSLPKMKGITVNTVHGNKSSIQKVVKKFRPDVESMEGAAFFFACNQEKIPCIQVRAISNYVERRNKKKWQLGLAIKNLNIFLERLLHSA